MASQPWISCSPDPGTGVARTRTAQRISRAKRAVGGVRFEEPGDLATVLRVLYLVFNEGYTGDVDLAAEAIRLTRQLASMTDDEEIAGLLALMLLHHARRPARTRRDGSLVPLAEQDRSRWNTRLIAEGVDVLQTALDVTDSVSSRPRPLSPPCTPTRRAPRRPTGCRSSAGTTSCSGSPAAR
jgi:predicted RNA polymerase sigma factor